MPRASAKKLNRLWGSCRDRVDRFLAGNRAVASPRCGPHAYRAGDASRPFARGDITGKHLHRRAFAGTIGPQEGHQFPFIDFEANVSSGCKRPIKLG